ncbi:hypothetical protein A3E39_04010 [Candidatus Uhrbacteria bacterium RIFCSPHIGHO2_12_FULL_60_25]|uniref:DUF5667 domain-containing protein n=1 Tax=Candidatus Uhrbacteria bacterium RIFCSPHIGHO2_12_FULL_60_25 TaxID=1802399 RepID=A0A1F7UNT1_9BACT|nr:MAG: hypothetical protein A3E39_04010 [Candidatus Uhrbacteria bacterium RIFCSPHIGHO2_12_FULL_60_25]
MRRSFILCFFMSACASAPATPPPAQPASSAVEGRSAPAPLESVHYVPRSSARAQLIRFGRIAKRHTRAVKSFERETDGLATPTTSVECEMLRLQCAAATMNVLLVNGSAVSAAAYVGLHVNEITLGQRSDPVNSSLDSYEKSVDALLERMEYARELYKTFATCRKESPPSLLPAVPTTL